MRILAVEDGTKGGNQEVAPGFYLNLTDLVTRMVDSKRSRRKIEASKRNSDQ